MSEGLGRGASEGAGVCPTLLEVFMILASEGVTSSAEVAVA